MVLEACSTCWKGSQLWPLVEGHMAMAGAHGEVQLAPCQNLGEAAGAYNPQHSGKGYNRSWELSERPIPDSVRGLLSNKVEPSNLSLAKWLLQSRDKTKNCSSVLTRRWSRIYTPHISPFTSSSLEWPSGKYPRALKETQNISLKEMGTPDVGTDTRFNKAAWTNGIGCLSAKHSEDEGSPNKLSTLWPMSLLLCSEIYRQTRQMV